MGLEGLLQGWNFNVRFWTYESTPKTHAEDILWSAIS
jgi:hypothetical protein